MHSETSMKGEMACLKLELRACEKGAIVSKPIIECDYDRIVDYNGKLYKVQVKWTNSKCTNTDGAVAVKLTRGARNNNIRSYTSSEIDAVVAYLPKTDKLYWLPPKVFSGKKTVNLRLVNSKNCQSIGCILASEYEW